MCCLTKDGIPKVTDFGLAKKVEGGGGLTQTGAIMGTPSYMAPEQASGEGKRVGPAADVYALGAILYCCLTGKPPFQGNTPVDTILQVVSNEPTPLRQINPKVPKDLETICLKCLQKQAPKRYASAEMLAEELRRYTIDKPITARPVGQAERVVKWVRRNPVVASLALVVLLVLASGLIGIGWAYRVALEQRSIAEKRATDLASEKRKVAQEKNRADYKTKEALKQLDLAQQATYVAQLNRVALVYQHDPFQGLEVLHDYRFCPIHRRCGGWRFYERQCSKWLEKILVEQKSRVTSVCLSIDGRTLAIANRDRTIKLWNTRTGKLKAILKGHQHIVMALSFSPDGQMLASAGEDESIKVWDLKTRRPKAEFNGGRSLIFNSDGTTLFVAGARRIILWDTRAEKVRATLNSPLGSVNCVSFEPVAKLLAAGYGDGKVRLWNLQTGKLTRTLGGHSEMVISVRFSPNGKTLVSACDDGEITLWNLATGQEIASLPGPNYVCDFSPDSKLLVTGGHDTIGVWDATNAEKLLVLKDPGGFVHSVCFMPRGRTLVSVGGRGAVKLWNLKMEEEKATLKEDTLFVKCLVFSPDGTILASGSGRGPVGGLKLWDVTTGKEKITLPGHTNWVTSVSISHDGRTLASGSWDKTVKLWDVSTGKLKATLEEHAFPVVSVCFSPKGRFLASASGEVNDGKKTGELKLWKVNKEQNEFILQRSLSAGGSLCFSPDGQTLAVAGNQIKLLDVTTGQEIVLFKERSSCVSFSPDGQTLVSASDRIKLWNVETRSPKHTVFANESPISSVGFSPDGQMLFSVDHQDIARFWDRKTGQEILRFSEVVSICFSRDGQTFASASYDQSIKLWDLSRNRVMAKLKGRESKIKTVRFSKNGFKLQSTDAQGNKLYWDLKTGQRINETPTDKFLPPDTKGPNGKLVAEIDGQIICLIDPTIPERRVQRK